LLVLGRVEEEEEHGGGIGVLVFLTGQRHSSLCTGQCFLVEEGEGGREGEVRGEESANVELMTKKERRQGGRDETIIV